MPAKRAVGSDDAVASPPLPSSSASASRTRRGKSLERCDRFPECGEIVQMADDGGIVVGASALRRACTRQASALSLSAAVSTGSTQRKAATSGGFCCAMPISEPIGRAIGGSAGGFSDISTRICGRRPGPVSNRLG